MKKIITAILCLALSLALCACGSAETPAETVTVTAPPAVSEPTAEPEPTAAPEPTVEPAISIDPQAETEALTALLEDIDQRSQPGTAGCSLKAVSIAADMLNWATATALDDQSIASVAAQWLEDKGYGQQSEFNMKLDLVYSAYLDLIAPDSADLMASAGVDYPEGNWGYEPLPAVEALEAAVGPSDVVY